jgi:CheY-like chemotaxis protein
MAQSVILLVDDDSGDVMLAQRAFLKARLVNPIRSLKSGELAIEYLSGEGEYSDREKYPMPALVLLDLKMPGKDGLEVLRWIRAHEDPQVNSLRVVVLTGSDAIRDVNSAYGAGANSFMIKPVDFERFAELSQAFGGSWLWMHQTVRSEAIETPRRVAR